MPLRICVLVSAYTKKKDTKTMAVEAENVALIKENQNPEDPSGACISALTGLDDYDKTPAHYFHDTDEFVFETVEMYRSTSYRDIRFLVHSKKYDCFFVLCDGAKDEDRAGEDVLRALEEFNVPYTGADLRHYDPSKLEMKMQAYYKKIPVPDWAVFKSFIPDVKHLHAEFEKLEIPPSTPLPDGSDHKLAFPVIVKHPHGFNSVGMTKDSKCYTSSKLMEQVNKMIHNFHGALIEKFIEGEEVTVLALQTTKGTKVLPPVKMRFCEGEDFKHFDLKWKTFDDIEWIPMDVDDPAYEEVMRIGKEAFDVMLGGVGVARSDLRICRKENKVYFLEINPNPGIMYPPGAEGSADMILKYNNHTFGHREATRALIEAALMVQQGKQKNYKIEFCPEKGYHCVAVRNIHRGDMVFSREGQEFTLCTRQFLEKHNKFYDHEKTRCFTWPLSPDLHVYAVREDDHTKWKPLTHRCDPNLMFNSTHSLDIVACRDISKGEVMTIDYATFCDVSEPIPCKCGAISCTGFISLENMHKKYGRNTFHRQVRTK